MRENSAELTEVERKINRLLHEIHAFPPEKKELIRNCIDEMRQLYESEKGVGTGVTQKGLLADLDALHDQIVKGGIDSELLNARVAKHENAAHLRHVTGTVEKVGGGLLVIGSVALGATLLSPVAISLAGIGVVGGVAVSGLGFFTSKKGDLREQEAKDLHAIQDSFKQDP
jgi:hypothetical protein